MMHANEVCSNLPCLLALASTVFRSGTNCETFATTMWQRSYNGRSASAAGCGERKSIRSARLGLRPGSPSLVRLQPAHPGSNQRMGRSVRDISIMAAERRIVLDKHFRLRVVSARLAPSCCALAAASKVNRHSIRFACIPAENVPEGSVTGSRFSPSEAAL